MLGRCDAKNNPRDYGIARNFGSGSRDIRTLLGTLCGTSALVPLTSFRMETNGGIAKCRLFSQATLGENRRIHHDVIVYIFAL